MAVTNYSLLIGQNIDSINFKMADAIAEGLQPIGPPIDFHGVIVQGVGNITGTVTVYEILYGDNADQLSIRVAEAVAAGKQPLGNPTVMAGVYAQTVIVGEVGSDLLGATTYDLVYGTNPEQLSLKVGEAIAAGKQPFGTPAALEGIFVQAVITPSGGGGGDYCFNEGGQVFVVGDQLGSSGQGTVTRGLSPPLPDPITYIALDPASGIANFGQQVGVYKTGEAAAGVAINTLSFAARGGSMVVAEIESTKAIVQDGQTSGQYTFSVADSEVTAVSGGADVELDEGETFAVRNALYQEGTEVLVTVDDNGTGTYRGRFPNNAAPLKHGDSFFGGNLVADITAGAINWDLGWVVNAAAGDQVWCENTSGSKTIFGTAVAAIIGAGGPPGVRIDTPYNVVQNGDSMPFTKLDGTTLLGGSANCGIGADGKAVARLVGAQIALEDQQAVVVGGSTYTFTIVNNVITAIDIV